MTCVSGTALVSCASRQNVSNGGGYSLRQWPASRGYCTSSNGLTTVPLEWTGVHYAVRAKVNGQPLRLVLDTGAHFSMITPKAARQAGFDPSERAPVRGFAGTMRPQKFGVVRRIELGGAVVEDSPAVVIALPGQLAADGLLGSSFLQHFVTTIDLARSNITLCAADRFTPVGQGDTIPMVVDLAGPDMADMCFFLPFIEGEIDGVKAVFCLDTGAFGSVSLGYDFVAKAGFGQPPVNKSDRIDFKSGALGGNTRSYLVRRRTLVLGGLTVPGPVVNLSVKGDFAWPGCDGILELGVLKRFEVTLDYPGRRVWLRPNANYNLPPEVVCTCPGWRLRAVADGWKVTKVEPDSAAAEAGLRAGDIILTIDGHPATAAALAQHWKKDFHRPVGTQIRLRVKSPAGSTRDVTITRRDIL